MGRHRLWIMSLGLVLAGSLSVSAAELATRPLRLSEQECAVRSLAGRIDLHLIGAWRRNQVTAAPMADDAEFLRRVYLDLTGRIPPVSEARAFLDDTSADKRRRLVEELLNSSGYVKHMANVWRALLVPEAGSNLQIRALAPGMESWLREKFAENGSYEDIVRELLTVTLDGNMNAGGDPIEQMGDASPLAFYIAKEGKPENLAASTARLFLGLRLGCAQCHDHPMAQWKREQFWGMAAFFGGMQKRNADNLFAPVREITGNRDIIMPGREEVIAAAFLDGKEPKFEFKVSTRVTFADWLTAKENPFFVRTAVNRISAQFFGLGIVEPVDDFSEEHVPSHPQLLDELARDFAANDYDFKFLIRAITTSRAYQLASTQTHKSQEDPRWFSRMAVKSLTGEQVFDSVAQAIGYHEPTSERRPDQPFQPATGARAEFLAKFASQDGAIDTPTTILQALHLMNGNFVGNATNIERSQTLTAVAELPFLTTRQRIETLYLAALSRGPRGDEVDKLVSYVEKGGVRGNPKSALADVFWALLNSAEFLLNH